MILYFANRSMKIIGQASTKLPMGLLISDDTKVEDVDAGVKTFEAEIVYSNRKRAEAMAAPGNYLLRSSGDEAEFYTIIDSELDSEERTVHIYAEDAGLDLINTIVGPYEAPRAMTIAEYTAIYNVDTGFEIGINEVSTYSRKLEFEGEVTATERLRSLASAFDAEISFSFRIDKLRVVHKYINYWKKRGKATGETLRVGKHISKIRIIRSVANLATGLYVTGGTPEGSNDPITLQGYSYDDGDIYVSGNRLLCRSAIAKWSRYLSPDEQGTGQGHIIKRWSYDTTSQSELCARAVTKLKKAKEPEVNYEAEVVELPAGVQVGDTVRVADSEGNLFFDARILEMKTMECKGKREITLGDYLIRSSGLSEQLVDLQRKVDSLSGGLTLYTWIAYADDDEGTGISLDPEGKEYIGIAANRVSETPDITDPTVYTWQRAAGEAGADGEDATLMRIDSSRGVVFKSNAFSTVLTVTIIYGAQTITDITGLRAAFGASAHLQWYYKTPDENSWHTMLATDTHITNNGFALTVSPDDVDEQILFQCDLEV